MPASANGAPANTALVEASAIPSAEEERAVPTPALEVQAAADAATGASTTLTTEEAPVTIAPREAATMPASENEEAPVTISPREAATMPASANGAPTPATRVAAPMPVHMDVAPTLESEEVAPVHPVPMPAPEEVTPAPALAGAPVPAPEEAAPTPAAEDAAATTHAPEEAVTLGVPDEGAATVPTPEEAAPVASTEEVPATSAVPALALESVAETRPAPAKAPAEASSAPMPDCPPSLSKSRRTQRNAAPCQQPVGRQAPGRTSLDRQRVGKQPPAKQPPSIGPPPGQHFKVAGQRPMGKSQPQQPPQGQRAQPPRSHGADHGERTSPRRKGHAATEAHAAAWAAARRHQQVPAKSMAASAQGAAAMAAMAAGAAPCHASWWAPGHAFGGQFYGGGGGWPVGGKATPAVTPNTQTSWTAPVASTRARVAAESRRTDADESSAQADNYERKRRLWAEKRAKETAARIAAQAVAEKEKQAHADGGPRYFGRIKAFSIVSGFGFIQSDQISRLYGRDAFLSHAVEGGIVVGGMVSFTVELNKEGHPQARNVRLEAVDEHSGDTASLEADLAARRQMERQVRRGRVKSFNAARGFGFLVCPELQYAFGGRDIYVSKTQVPDGRLMAGQEVDFQLHLDRHGLPQAQHVTAANGIWLPT